MADRIDHMNEYGEHAPHAHYPREHYVEPDIYAHLAKDQIPNISSIGRGPRGAGIYVQEIIEGNGSEGYRLAFMSDETDEAIAITPNLCPGTIDVSIPDHTPQEGEFSWFTISYRQGSDVLTSKTLPIPPGAHGSRMYLSDYLFTYREDQTYTTYKQDLTHYGRSEWKDKPTPRPGDIIAFIVLENDHRKVGFGTIEAVENDEVVFTSRTIIDIPAPYINEDGNWVADGKDTGIKAQGPKGDKGLPAIIEIGNVEKLPPTSNASVSAVLDPETNITTLNFGIPEGAAGKAININGGIWKPSYLPKYDDTPINDAFIVYDGDKQFDLYIRGQYPVMAEEGGPWTVVENWQGRPGNGVHFVNKPYNLSATIGDEVSVPASEGSIVFYPSDYLSDGDVLIDSAGSIGILSSAEDDSGDYTMTTTGTQRFFWESVENKPFSSVDTTGILDITNGVLSATATWELLDKKPFNDVLQRDGLVITDGILNIDRDLLSPKWDKVRNKPFNSVDTSGVLNIENDVLKANVPTLSWDNITNKPYLQPTVQISQFRYYEQSNMTQISFEADIPFPGSVNRVQFTVNNYTFNVNMTKQENGKYGGHQQIQGGDYRNIDFAVYLIIDGVERAHCYYNNDPAPWDLIPNKPFERLGNGLEVTDGILSASSISMLKSSDYDDNIGLPSINGINGSMYLIPSLHTFSYNDLENIKLEGYLTFNPIQSTPFFSASTTSGSSSVISSSKLFLDPGKYHIKVNKSQYYNDTVQQRTCGIIVNEEFVVPYYELWSNYPDGFEFDVVITKDTPYLNLQVNSGNKSGIQCFSIDITKYDGYKKFVYLEDMWIEI